jgi:multiple sugar transport system permease protein
VKNPFDATRASCVAGISQIPVPGTGTGTGITGLHPFAVAKGHIHHKFGKGIQNDTSVNTMKRWNPNQQSEGYLFLLPSLLGVLVFTVFPVLFAVFIAFTEWNLVSPPKFIGLANFTSLFTQDVLAGQVAVNTVFFVLTIVPLQVVLSLLLALALNRPLRAMGLFRGIYYVPVITTIVAAAIVFQFMFDRDYGLVNAPMWWLGDVLQIKVDPPNWIGSSQWSKWSVVILTLWKNVGFTTLLFLAALQSVPKDLQEAAMIDGASRTQRLRNITLPLISPTTFFIVVILIIGAFRLFDEPFVMTRGGPAGSSTTAVMYIYQTAFQFSNLGKASAIALVLFVVIFGITLLQQRLQRRWVYYETGAD